MAYKTKMKIEFLYFKRKLDDSFSRCFVFHDLRLPFRIAGYGKYVWGSAKSVINKLCVVICFLPWRFIFLVSYHVLLYFSISITTSVSLLHCLPLCRALWAFEPNDSFAHFELIQIQDLIFIQTKEKILPHPVFCVSFDGKKKVLQSILHLDKIKVVVVAIFRNSLFQMEIQHYKLFHKSIISNRHIL